MVRAVCGMEDLETQRGRRSGSPQQALTLVHNPRYKTRRTAWYLAPPACFTSSAPTPCTNHPLENLLLEHASMSVYLLPLAVETQRRASDLYRSAPSALMECNVENNKPPENVDREKPVFTYLRQEEEEKPPRVVVLSHKRKRRLRQQMAKEAATTVVTATNTTGGSVSAENRGGSRDLDLSGRNAQEVDKQLQNEYKQRRLAKKV